MTQQLVLEINEVVLFSFNGPDKLCLRINDPDIINKATEGKLHQGLKGTDIIGKSLDFSVEISYNCGRKLANLLGLKIDRFVGP